MRKVNYRGFAFVDLLLASICVTIIASLSMPLLLHMRSQSRLDTCERKLRELVLASHNFHDAYRRMPPATLGYNDVVNVENWNEEGNEVFWKLNQNTSSILITAAFTNLRPDSLAVHDIAKDMEKNLHAFNAVADTKFEWQGEIEGIDGVYSNQHESLLCPEDDLVDQDVSAVIATQTAQPFEVNEMESNDYCRDIVTQNFPVEEETVGLTNYIACIGVTGSVWSDDAEMLRWRGAMTMGDKVSLETVRDGTSRTLMYGESLGEIVDEERVAAMSWLWGGAGRVTGNLPFDPSTVEDSDEIPMFGNTKNSSGVGFGSKHEDVVMFGFCDGSVHRLKLDVNRQTLYELAGAGDGGVPLDF